MTINQWLESMGLPPTAANDSRVQREFARISADRERLNNANRRNQQQQRQPQQRRAGKQSIFRKDTIAAGNFVQQFGRDTTEAMNKETMANQYVVTSEALENLNKVQRRTNREFSQLSFLSQDATKYVQQHGSVMSDLKDSLGGLNIGYEEIGNAVFMMHKGFSATRVETEANNRLMAQSIVLNEQQGVKMNDSIAVMETQRRAFGMNTQEMLKFRQGVLDTSDALGVDMAESYDTLRTVQTNYMGNTSAVMGQFKQFQAMQMATGVSGQRLAESFGGMAQTQQAAAEVTSKLNAYFGQSGGFLSTQEFMRAKPSQKMKMVLDQVRNSNKDIKGMLESGSQEGVMLLNFLKSTQGFGSLNQNEIASLIRADPAELEQHLAKIDQATNVSSKNMFVDPKEAFQREKKQIRGMMSPRARAAATAREGRARLVPAMAGGGTVGFDKSIQMMQSTIDVLDKGLFDPLAGFIAQKGSIQEAAGAFKAITEVIGGPMGAAVAGLGVMLDQVTKNNRPGTNPLDRVKESIGVIDVAPVLTKLTDKVKNLKDKATTPAGKEQADSVIRFLETAKKNLDARNKKQDPITGGTGGGPEVNVKTVEDLIKSHQRFLQNYTTSAEVVMDGETVGKVVWKNQGGNIDTAAPDGT